MEVDGMLRIFNRSEKLHNLKYSNYIGDGDTKTINALSENKPYGDDYLIQKIECVGHVQKRMGTRLMKLKLVYSKKELSDGKTIGGKGRLTDSLIDKLAHYYGNAIRCNSTSVKEMRKAIWAVWGHSCSTDDEPIHWFCPTNPNTWCKYNAAINNNLQNYKHKPSVAKAVQDAGRAVLLARWIVRSIPLEIVGSSGHEKVPTRGKPDMERPGRPRRENRKMRRQALVDPKVTRSTIRADVGVAIVPQTISRHLAEANLNYKRPFRALPLTPELRQLYLQWCQARSRWNVTDWQKAVFSNTARTAGVMVCGAITYDSRSTLIVMRGTLTGQRYVDDILRSHVGPFLNGLPGAIFQHDNVRTHTTRVAQGFLRHFQTLSWAARSPDLSPVEHVWDQLKQQMLSCHSVHDLELAVQDLWAHLPQDNIRCLINSMPDRVAACIAAEGGPTLY
ncbi:transposable element Tc1 transposase [Trichonephila clavipes]|nr:transposable element Tc1 transposase [Trichonephila clavipes]